MTEIKLNNPKNNLKNIGHGLLNIMQLSMKLRLNMVQLSLMLQQNMMK